MAYCEQFEDWYAKWVADPANKRRMFNVWINSIPKVEFHDDERENPSDQHTKDCKETDLNTEWTR